jgi:hypothetical protein
MQTQKALILAGLLALPFSGAVTAQTVYNGTLGTWFTTGTPTVVSAPDASDVIFTPIPLASNVNNEKPVGAIPFSDSLTLNIGRDPLSGLYFFDMTNLAGNLNVNTTYALQYYIDVDGWFGQGDRLGLVLAGVNTTVEGVYTFTKQVTGVTPGAGQNPEDPNDPADNTWNVFGSVFDESLTTEGGDFAEIFCGECTRFLVTDVLVVPGTVSGTLSSLTNNYNLVPVPATLALFGAGLVGMGFLTRRSQLSGK